MAESFAKRALDLLAKIYPGDDAVFQAPLLILGNSFVAQNKIAAARTVLRRVQSLRTDGPDVRARLLGFQAMLLQVEHRYEEAEGEYIRAVAYWNASDHAASAEVLGVFLGLAGLYTEQDRFEEAHRTLARGLDILHHAQNAIVTDRIVFLGFRGALYFRQRQWRYAERDLRLAVSLAASDAQMDAAALKPIFLNYAAALRKTHRAREARDVEARVAGLGPGPDIKELVDLSQLRADSKH